MSKRTSSTIPPETVSNPDDALFANPRFLIYLLKQIDTKMDEQKMIYSSSQAEVKLQIEKQFEEVNKKLEDIPSKYVTKEEHRATVDAIRADYSKADKSQQEDIDNINGALSKVNWLVITAVVLALLGTILVNRGGL